MDDTMTTAQATAEMGTTTPETFTQEQVSQMVAEQLEQERSTLAQKEQELQQREFKANATETLIEKGLPASLFDALNTTSPEAFNNAVALVESLVSKSVLAETGPRFVPPGAFTAQGNPTGLGGTAAGDDVRNAMGLKR